MSNNDSSTPGRSTSVGSPSSQTRTCCLRLSSGRAANPTIRRPVRSAPTALLSLDPSGSASRSTAQVVGGWGGPDPAAARIVGLPVGGTGTASTAANAATGPSARGSRRILRRPVGTAVGHGRSLLAWCGTHIWSGWSALPEWRLRWVDGRQRRRGPARLGKPRLPTGRSWQQHPRCARREWVEPSRPHAAGTGGCASLGGAGSWV
jgi:hypothetical protein